MIIPVRCFSCGSVIADKYDKFVKKADGKNSKEVLNSLGVTRYCCRRMILSHADFIDEVVKFDERGP